MFGDVDGISAGWVVTAVVAIGALVFAAIEHGRKSAPPDRQIERAEQDARQRAALSVMADFQRHAETMAAEFRAVTAQLADLRTEVSHQGQRIAEQMDRDRAEQMAMHRDNVESAREIRDVLNRRP